MNIYLVISIILIMGASLGVLVGYVKGFCDGYNRRWLEEQTEGDNSTYDNE